MKWFMLSMLVVGTLLLAVILRRTDLTEVWSLLAQIGFGGSLVLLALYTASFGVEAAAWLFTLVAAPFTATWVYRCWKLLMVGTAFEYTVPAGGLGGEPVKAIILKQRYGLLYRDATASLVLQKMADVSGQLVFISAGLLLILQADILSPRYRFLAITGLVLLMTGVFLFFLVQRYHGASRLGRWLEQGWLGRQRFARHVSDALAAIHDVEKRLIEFYTASRVRLVMSVLLNLGNWIGNGVVVWVALSYLGAPMGFGQAVIIEAFVILVRSSLFFVPGYIGTQEGAYVLICEAMTGSAEIGLALATIRRARDLVWIGWGLAIASTYSLQLKPSTT